MTFRRTLLSALFATLVTGPASAAGSLDEGVANLAGQIVQKTLTDDTVTIGITTFPHADNSCSELSNYLADLLVVSLFDVGQGKVQIVERAQLTTIFEELSFTRSGAVDTSTAKELGKIYGVDALVIGSLTEIGDEIAIVARLISTETGTVFSAARSGFPKTATVETLMKKRSPALCGYGSGSASGTGTRGQTTQAATAAPKAAEGTASFTTDGFEVRVLRLIYSHSDKTATFILRFTNSSDKRIHLAVMAKSISITDDLGRVLAVKDTWSGVKLCQKSAPYCTANYPERVTSLEPGKAIRLTFNAESAAADPPQGLNVAFELVYTPDPKSPRTHQLISFSLDDLVPEVR